MIIDARRDIANGASPAFDLCIVGSGPAGLTLALELAPLGLRIAVLEAGGRAFSKKARSISGVRSRARTATSIFIPSAIGGSAGPRPLGAAGA